MSSFLLLVAPFLLAGGMILSMGARTLTDESDLVATPLLDLVLLTVSWPEPVVVAALRVFVILSLKLHFLEFAHNYFILNYLSLAFSASSSSPLEEVKESDRFLAILVLLDEVLLVSLTFVHALVPFVIVFLVLVVRGVELSWFTLSTDDDDGVRPMFCLRSLKMRIN